MKDYDYKCDFRKNVILLRFPEIFEPTWVDDRCILFKMNLDENTDESA